MENIKDAILNANDILKLTGIIQEVENNSIGLRSRKDGDLGQISLEEFVEKIKKEINNYEK